ncbi:sugar ABC transporter substrate-binding protein [Paenibacillus sp. sgz302251]|uniref:sugar ABC transporter substrate-binding protein n=1 Tax=Paenibacillus sp. sgz302251 TaxID=3414493 RepID=UPI003C7D9A1D
MSTRKITRGKSFVSICMMLVLIVLAACGNNTGSTSGASNTQNESAPDKKYKIYLNLSYSGNAWQNEAANIIMALAQTPPYDKMVEIKKVISGADAQKQISDLQSMIADGADGIIAMPISPTALNAVVQQGCDQGVKMFFYDGTVTNNCGYNVTYVTAGHGQNTAQYLVNLLGGEGKIFMSRGVAGNGVDLMLYEGAMSVFNKYPGIEIVSEYYSNWDDVQTKTNTMKALAAYPDVDGIWAEAGEFGAVQALKEANKKVPVVGENSNGFRLALANKEIEGVSAGAGPAYGGYSFKLMMELLTGAISEEELPHNVEYPLPWVPSDQVKVCEGDEFVDGCNAFPDSKVPTSFVTEVFNPILVPEISLDSALNGNPTPGATIQPIPKDAIKEAPNAPGINCDKCEAPADLYKVNEELVKPLEVPVATKE